MRILVAFEDKYRIFRHAIADALRASRPGDEEEDSALASLAERVARFDPHLVIASAPSADPAGRLAWVELSPEPGRTSRVCVGGRRSEASNPSMEDLLSVASEAEGLIGDERRPRAC